VFGERDGTYFLTIPMNLQGYKAAAQLRDDGKPR